MCSVLYTVGDAGGAAETGQRVASLVRSLNFQVLGNTWLGVNNGWSRISYYCKCCVTAGRGSKGQISHQIINASCRAEPQSGGAGEEEQEEEEEELHREGDGAS